jgi:predicted nucleotidyltransferase
MTLDLNTVPPIAGENAMRIRDILRRSHGAFREDWLTNKFRYDARTASGIAMAMVVAGYVQRDEEREDQNHSPFRWYSVTETGRDVIRASAAKRIKRETAATELTEFMKRVHMVNASPKYLYSVKRVVVFGSFLERRERLGDVDVAVNFESRVAIKRGSNWVEIFRQHAWDSGRSFSTWEEEVDWPRREVLLLLKSRKRSISIQSWYSFVEMEKSTNFRFKVLLGDARQVGRELAKAERERMQESLELGQS